MNKNINNIPLCKILCTNDKIVVKVQDKLPKPDSLNLASNIFKVIAEPARIKIILALSISELCVCDLGNLIQYNQSALSHQLRILRQTNIVKYRKEGKIVYYSLKNYFIKKIINQVLKEVGGIHDTQ